MKSRLVHSAGILKKAYEIIKIPASTKKQGGISPLQNQKKQQLFPDNERLEPKMEPIEKETHLNQPSMSLCSKS